MPSWPTGQGSVGAGEDSALTADGVCAPLHPDFIKDGASFLTGRESVLTAAQPDPCGELLPPITPDGFLWLNNKLSPTGLMTKDGSNRVSTWVNQFTGVSAAVDATSEDAPGVPEPVSQWPVWTPTQQNGLPMMAWSRAAFTHMHGHYPLGTFNKPTADGAPVSILAVVRVSNPNPTGGMFLTLRRNNDDLECGLYNYGGPSGYQAPMTCAQQNKGVIFGHGLTVDIFDFSGQTLILAYQYFGPGIRPVIRINGVAPSLYQVDTNLVAYTGDSGYSVGFCNAVFDEIWDGYIGEILGYIGTDAATFAAAETYLNAKWAVY
jgi:hypothetical protein